MALQQTPKYSGLVRRFRHHPLDPILWDPAFILEDSKLSGVLGIQGLVVWIHEKLQLDPFRLVCVRSIILVCFLHIGNRRNVRSRAQKEAKQWRIWKTYSWPLSAGLIGFDRSVITVLYNERTIAVYGSYLF
jgi:hypothetical protein